MLFILLFIAILFYDFAYRLHEYKQGSKCISMNCFKIKEYLPKFNEIYDNVFKETECMLEPLRQKCKAIMTLKIVSYISALWILASGVYELFTPNKTLALVVITFSIALFSIAVYTEKFVNLYYCEYLEKYKELFINKYVRDINKGFGYTLRGCIEQKIYEVSYPDKINVEHYYGTDYITGVVEGKRTLNMCEIYARQRINGKKDIFCGLFTYLKTDYNDEMIVECKSKNISYKNIPLNMQVGIERFIKEFEKNQRIDFKLLMRNGKIFVKLYSGDLLAPNVFSTKINKKRMWAYYVLIKFSVDLTELINTVRVNK